MNKQIEEMAKILCVDYGDCVQCICKSIESIGDGCTIKLDCERLYNAGYRKQIEAKWYYGVCANCGHEALDYLDDCTVRTYITKYCPNCGAKMKGE